MGYAGLVLAAGAGVRAGGPKALRVDDAGRPWVEIAAASLRDAGCEPAVVVLGAAADEARTLVPEWARVVVASRWAAGQSESLRAGLEALGGPVAGGEAADGVLVTLVDLPWQGADEARAVLSLADRAFPASSLARLLMDGNPGHPVLIGRDHWDPLVATLAGDEGARVYLAAHAVRSIPAEMA